MKMELGGWASVKMGGRLDQESAIKAAKARIALNAGVRERPVACIVPIPMDPPISSIGPVIVTGTFNGQEFSRLRLPPKLLDIAKAARDFFREAYDISAFDLMSHRRNPRFVGPRHVVFYLCKILTTRSLPEIGQIVGEGRDHTTILHAYRRVRRLVTVARDDETISDAVNIIELLKKRGFRVEIPPDLEPAYRARPQANSNQGTADDLA